MRDEHNMPSLKKNKKPFNERRYAEGGVRNGEEPSFRLIPSLNCTPWHPQR